MLFPSPEITSPRRVAVTGAGIITAHGIGWKKNADGFKTGRRSFVPVTLFDVSRQRVKTAAQINLPDHLPPTRFSERQLQRLDRAARMLLFATHEAVEQAAWPLPQSIPFILGTTAGGMTLGESYFRTAMQEPSRQRQQPTRALHYQSQTQARGVAEALGFCGPILLVSNACASGANAIGQAWEMIRNGQAERVLTGGYDALSQLVFSGFDSLQALSPTTCRPFDAARDGLALGEGAAVLALENFESAQKRGATILAEIAGYGTSIDLHHLTQPHPEGQAALESMNAACEVAAILPEQVDYLNAHGTGTSLNDSSEAAAVNRWANGHVHKLRVSSTKAGIGHLLGAAGAVEAVVCVMTLREQWLPPQTNLATPDPLCQFQLLRAPQEAEVEIVGSNSFGFGGINATLMLRQSP